MSGVIICAPAGFPLRRVTMCGTEGRRRRFAGYAHLWYSTRWTCLGCGDSWEDGDRAERPFRRAWRGQEIAHARRIWDEAGQYTDQDFRDWFQAQLDDDLRASVAATHSGELSQTSKEQDQ